MKVNEGAKKQFTLIPVTADREMKELGPPLTVCAEDMEAAANLARPKFINRGYGQFWMRGKEDAQVASPAKSVQGRFI